MAGAEEMGTHGRWEKAEPGGGENQPRLSPEGFTRGWFILFQLPFVLIQL